MSYRASLILFSWFVFAGFALFVIARIGWYPVAMVNFSFITAADLQKDILTTEKYYYNLSLLFGKDKDIFEKPQARKELRRAALDNLISDSLIYAELKKNLGGHLQSIAENKIQEALKNNSKISEGVKKLYSLTLDEFKEQVLLSQAYKEILQGRMFLENKDFNEWLKNARANARILILISDLNWENGGVEVR